MKLFVEINNRTKIIDLSCEVFIRKVFCNALNKFSLAADKLAVGDIDVNIEIRSNDEICKPERSFNLRTENIKVQAGNAEKIAQGDLSAEVKLKSEKDVIPKSLIKMIAFIGSLVNENISLSIEFDEVAATGNIYDY
jgi:methyl-accepting chemotaxis protein